MSSLCWVKGLGFRGLGSALFLAVMFMLSLYKKMAPGFRNLSGQFPLN